MQTSKPAASPVVAKAASAAAAAVTKKASELGCALNVNLDTGAGTAGVATDDTALLNAFLATASATNPIVLIIDGAALITGLRLSPAGYTSIQGSGDATGFFLAQGSNNDGIHNRPPGYVNDPGPPAPPRVAQQVSLLNFRLNGNRGDGRSGNSTTGDTHGGPAWLFGINLMDMEHVTIDRVTVFHASTYSIRLSNVGHATLTRCRLAPFGPAETVTPTNTDGIHINGPGNDIAISGCYFRTGDDAVALNAPEGHTGNIARVTVTDCVFDGCQIVGRIYTGSRAPFVISDATFSGLTGTSNVRCFQIGLEDRGTLTFPDALQNILIHNCQLTGAYFAFIQDNIREITFRDIVWTGTDAAYGMVATANHALSIGTMTLNKCTVLRTHDANGAVCVVDLRGLYTGDFPVQLGELVVDGLTCIGAPGYTTGSLESLVLMSKGSQIATIDVETADARKIPRIVPDDEWPQVLKVTGAGLLQSGWSVPDGKVAANVPYLSDETQVASVVVDGEPHTLLHGVATGA